MISKNLIKELLKCGSIIKSTPGYDVVQYGSLYFKLLKRQEQYVKVIGRSWSF